MMQPRRAILVAGLTMTGLTAVHRALANTDISPVIVSPTETPRNLRGPVFNVPDYTEPMFVPSIRIEKKWRGFGGGGGTPQAKRDAQRRARAITRRHAK